MFILKLPKFSVVEEVLRLSSKVKVLTPKGKNSPALKILLKYVSIIKKM